MKRCHMGVDIGTSGCKAAVFDENGNQMALAYREYDLLSPQPGWAELDSDEVIDKCFAVIREAAANTPGGNVGGLGIGSQGEAFVPVDKEGRVLSNAIVSSDSRAADYAVKWPREFDETKLYEITGHTAHPLFSLFKLLWLRDHRPEIWAQAVKFLCFEDFLQFRLGVDPAISWPLAGRTMLFDVRRHVWSTDLLDAVGLTADKLARPLAGGSVAGRVAPETARDLGLAEDAFVVTAGHDQPCGALGAGVTSPGVAMYATGTVECITAAFSEPVFTENLRSNNLCTYDHVVPGMYATIAYSLTGGNILKWFRDEFGMVEVQEAQKAGKDAYDLILANVEDKPSGLLVLPYFTPSGTPYFDTELAGAMLGLRLSTTRGEFVRALLEGVTYEMRLNLEILQESGCEVRELRAVGGGAKSDLWTQLKADIMGKPVAVLNVTEAVSLGAAMLARAADTDESLAELVERWIRPIGMKLPRPENAAVYDEQFATYRQLYPLLKKLRWPEARAQDQRVGGQDTA